MAEADYITHSIIVADMRADEEYHMPESDSPYRPDINAGADYTGTQGWRLLGPCSGFGIGRIPVDAKTVRLGYWMRMIGWFPDSMAFLHGMSADYTREDLRIWLNPTNFTLEVMEYQSGPDDMVVISRAFDIHKVLSNIYEWQHIGIYYDVEDALLTMYANGTVAIQAVGLTILPPTNVFVGNTGLVGNYLEIDDYYVDYSPNVETNEPPPARRFYPSLPAGIGSSSDWTPQGAANNYQAVDESTAPDGETTYVLAASNGLLDMYDFTDLTIHPNESVTAALIQAYVTLQSHRDGGWGSLRFAFGDTGSSQYGNKKTISFNWPETNEWVVLTDRMDSKPSGGEWSEAEFNGGEFGYESADLI